MRRPALARLIRNKERTGVDKKSPAQEGRRGAEQRAWAGGQIKRAKIKTWLFRHCSTPTSFFLKKYRPRIETDPGSAGRNGFERIRLSLPPPRWRSREPLSGEARSRPCSPKWPNSPFSAELLTALGCLPRRPRHENEIGPAHPGPACVPGAVRRPGRRPSGVRRYADPRHARQFRPRRVRPFFERRGEGWGLWQIHASTRTDADRQADGHPDEPRHALFGGGVRPRCGSRDRPPARPGQALPVDASDR